MYQKYTGIILKKYPFGEADELLTIFTKEAGKIRAKAVSSRKIKSRLGGYLQTLNEVEFETAGRGNMPVVMSVRSRTVNNYLREDLKKFAYALIGIETLYRMIPDRQASTASYAALLEFLRELRERRPEKVALRRFQIQLLRVMGFGPNEEITAMFSEGILDHLSSEAEAAIDRFLYEVLEREIKSTKFLGSLQKISN